MNQEDLFINTSITDFLILIKKTQHLGFTLFSQQNLQGCHAFFSWNLLCYFYWKMTRVSVEKALFTGLSEIPVILLEVYRGKMFSHK